MEEDSVMPNSENTQTQTQNSHIEFSQPNNTPSFIPNIWGRLYLTKISKNGKYCWKSANNPEYCDLIEPEFTLGRALHCSFIMKKDVIKENIIKNVSKLHFTIKRDMSEPLSPAIITDMSYNGTFVNGEKIGKGNSRVLDNNDSISVTHQIVKIFVFKDLLKNEQDKVPNDISKKYYISRTLGQGACGVVKLVFNKIRCTKFAMKIIKKCRLTNGQLNHLNDPKKIMNEINIMKALRHPCIISTEEVFDSSDAVYIILELMQGGELFDRIYKYGHFSEPLTRFLFRQMVLAVQYLHSQGITHRDLKPENVLLEGKEDETLVKITDFGLSKFVGEDSFMKTMCGTPLYLAPEVLRANGQRSYGPEVDVWSLGVIFFICLVGYLPFAADYKDMTLRDQILHGRYKYSMEQWKGVSLQAKLLMKRMLTVQVNRRITLDQILKHPWMQHRTGQVDSSYYMVGATRALVAQSNPDNKVKVRCQSHLFNLGPSRSLMKVKITEVTPVRKLAFNREKSGKKLSKDTDVIIRVEKMLSKNMCLSSISSTYSTVDENSTASDSVTEIMVTTGKRCLSDTSSSCEPIPKKLRIGFSCDKDVDTGSTNSYSE